MCFHNSHKACPQEDECQICYEKSFASHEKAAFWSDRNQSEPWQFKISSHKKFWFNCPKSGHEFEITLGHIINKRWCPYPCCGNQKLCSKEDCELCLEASFASHPKAEFWSDKNKLSPREVFKQSHVKYWFMCFESGHEFEIALSSVTNEQWCSYPCCGNQKLCFEKDCDICWEASFASHPRTKFWHQPLNNDINPRDVFKQSHKKFWFKCPKSKHIFQSALSSVTRGRWCPYPCCSSPPKKLCLENCQICWEASFASSDKIQYWSDKNELLPREVFKSSDKKIWFNCANGHKFESILGDITRGQWCLKCNIWKNQKECLEIIEQITSDKFKQVKPKFLKGLELDGYNSKLQLAFEYNGIQHYEYVPFFHRNDPENLTKQQERDKLKQKLCTANNVYLIVIPYWTVDKKQLISDEYYNYIKLIS